MMYSSLVLATTLEKKVYRDLYASPPTVSETTGNEIPTLVSETHFLLGELIRTPRVPDMRVKDMNTG